MDGASKTNTKLSFGTRRQRSCDYFHDVNVEALAVAAVTAKLRNAGQVCIAPQRFFVHEKIYDQFWLSHPMQSKILRWVMAGIPRQIWDH